MTKSKDLQVGRPSKYDPAFCERAIITLAKGHSITGLAGDFGVGVATLYRWEEAHDEFREALNIGRAKAALHWEQTLLDISEGKIEGGSAAAAIFALKNRASGDWREKIEHNVGGVNGNEAIKVEVEHHVAELADNFTSKMIELAAKRGGDQIPMDIIPDKVKVEE